MNQFVIIARTFVAKGITRSLCLVVASLLMTVSVCGQSQSLTDGATPLGIAPGAPAGSYALSGFDNINLYNGNLNFRLPLLTIGGRGGAQYTITLPIEKHWTARHSLFNGSFYLHFPEQFWWRSLASNYEPGIMAGRSVNDGTCGTQGPQVTESHTRLTFTASDGTEYELRDVLNGGTSEPSFCVSPTGAPRGKIFVTADGTSATFISDTDIYDQNAAMPGGSFLFYPSGRLMMRDGTRYRIDAGKVTSIRDRNGNTMSFIYTNGALTKIIDSLNREVIIQYGVQEGQPYGLCDRIIYKGFGGATRIIRISYADLVNVLRSGYQPKTVKDLFPLLDGSSSTINNPRVYSAVWLPDETRAYRFYYNSHGELARVELPTGGSIEYDWGAALAGGDSTGIAYVRTVLGETEELAPEIYRRVLERRIYSSGSALENRTTYSQIQSQGTDPVTDAIDVTVESRDQGGALLARSKHFFHGNPIPFRAQERLDYSPWKEGREYRTDEFDTDGTTILRRVTNTWQQPVVGQVWPLVTAETNALAKPNDPQIIETQTRLMLTNQQTKQTFAFDRYLNRTDVYEYDFGTGATGSLVRRTHTDFLAFNGFDYAADNNIHIRNLALEQTVYDGVGAERARMSYEYDNYTQGIASRPGISGHDPAFSPSYITRGNVTEETKWLLPSAQLSTRMQYDEAGNVTSSTDPMGRTTSFDYSDRFGSPDSEARSNTPPAELNGQTSYGFATRVTNPLGHIAYTQFDYYLGRAVNGEDANGVVASGSYADALDRATQIDVAVGTPLQHRAIYQYDDAARKVTTRSDLNNYADGLLRNEIIYDSLGRTVETRQYENSTAYIKTTQIYDGAGRVARSHNPHRTTSEDSYGWTETTYDGLSRAKRAETFDKNGVSTGAVTTSYNDNQTTVTDQAGKKRRSVVDALGRLKQVDELNMDGTLYAATFYLYDTLDNLVRATQGSQQRFFMYDSLSRLIRARNPEQNINTALNLTDALTSNSQWTMSYVYDNNSNLTQRIDSRNIQTNYGYDLLNRVTNRSYLNDPQATPAVSYFYDNQSLPVGAPSFARGSAIGRLVGMSYGVGSAGTYQGYDVLGRVSVSFQQTDSQNYQVSYGYGLAGNLTSQIYPSGKEYRTSYDSAGRISSVSRYISGGFDKTYASQFVYSPHGGMTSITLGNSTVETMEYNSRLQPKKIELRKTDTTLLLGLDYGYGTSNNNGNVQSQTIRFLHQSSTITINQSYEYDSLNRLTSAQESVSSLMRWTQSYGYDRWGNRTSLINTGSEGGLLPTQSTPSVDAATNRLVGYVYDAAGNVKTDASGNQFDYDAENRQVRYNNGAAVYTYDGDGRRVKKTVGTETTLFVYNAGGQLIAEYGQPQGGGGTSYLTSDHLGSTRLVTDGAGAVKARHDYLPFGEETGSGVGSRTAAMGYGAQADNLRQKFTSYERDSESGLDYAKARYYSNAQGRFTSVDPFNPILRLEGSSFIGWISDPQRWNRYSYGLNNPLRNIDPNGENSKSALKQAVRRVKQAAGSLAARGVSGALRNAAAGAFNPAVLAAQLTIEYLNQLWPTIRVDLGNLKNPDERRFAHFVAAFEGKSFQGVDEAGTDGYTYRGNVPVSLITGLNDFRLVQLKTLTTDRAKNIDDEAKAINQDVKNAGKSGVYAYIELTNPNVTVNALVSELVTDAPSEVSLVSLTQGEYLPQVTFVLNDGIVRVDQGRIFACDSEGKCRKVKLN